jgi:hypothetical protein
MRLADVGAVGRGTGIASREEKARQRYMQQV